MTSNIVEQICIWNYVRENHKYDKKLEAKMLSEELEEYLSSEEGTANELKELADIIFVAIGSMYKITGNAPTVKSIIQAVINHNNGKGTAKDENGKIRKNKHLPPAEDIIDEILGASNERV